MTNLNTSPRGGILCLSKAGLAIGSDTAKVKVAAPNGAGVDYAIGGIIYHEADGDDAITMVGDTQTALYSKIYVVTDDASLDLLVVPGVEVLTADLTAGVDALRFPDIAATLCPIGYIIIDAGASPYVPGTTALTGGTVTVTYVDVLQLPTSPLNR